MSKTKAIPQLVEIKLDGIKHYVMDKEAVGTMFLPLIFQVHLMSSSGLYWVMYNAADACEEIGLKNAVQVKTMRAVMNQALGLTEEKACEILRNYIVESALRSEGLGRLNGFSMVEFDFAEGHRHVKRIINCDPEKVSVK